MERIEALVRFGTQGVSVKRITWREREYVVESTGRAWQAEDGWHVLVMLPVSRVVELRFDPVEMVWYMKPPVATA